MNIQKRELMAMLLIGDASRDDHYIVLEKLELFKLVVIIWLQYTHSTVMHHHIEKCKLKL